MWHRQPFTFSLWLMRKVSCLSLNTVEYVIWVFFFYILYFWKFFLYILFCWTKSRWSTFHWSICRWFTSHWSTSYWSACRWYRFKWIGAGPYPTDPRLAGPGAWNFEIIYIYIQLLYIALPPRVTTFVLIDGFDSVWYRVDNLLKLLLYDHVPLSVYYLLNCLLRIS